MLLAGPAASASGAANVRFVNATLGVEQAQLRASEGGISQKVGDAVRFGQVGSYARVPAGRVSFEARGANGNALATVRQQIRDRGHYTVVALGDGNRSLTVLRDGAARAAAARLRVVHAAPELGEVALRAGGRAVAERVGYESVASYTRIEPGSYELSATRPDDQSALASTSASLQAGSSSTAFVVGSAGEPVRVVVASDRTAAPRGGAATGLGGLADGGSPLLAALLAALLGGGLGVSAYLLVTGRSRDHGS